ncbi:MAG TPA: hypothetical protein VLB46_09020 [Pyrinomonadaceae bacterium]|nr:hypothetical protein [Pyrinomonadaceae bacterium]
MMTKFTLALILTLFFCPNSKPQTADAARREKAIELLESLATQLSNLQSAENRARIGANIADALWKHDEKRARALFISIEDDINWGLNHREINDFRDEYASMVFMQLRTDTVSRIAKHDPELALDFLKATAPTYENPPRSAIERERALEVKLAKQIVASNPDLALKIGRQSLSHGFSDDLLPLLRQLHKKHREQGVTLYKETVRKLRDADFTGRPGTAEFARSLAESLTPPLADELAFKDLLNILITAALTHRCGKPNEVDEARYFCGQLQLLLPQLQQVAPLQAAQLKHLADSDRQTFEDSHARYSDLQEALDSGDLDDVLALAEKYPDIQSSIYWQAVMKAQANGDIERARKIANDFNGDPEVRRRLLAQLDESEGLALLTDEQLTKVQTELAKMTRTRDRIVLLADVTNRLGAKNRAAALKLLDQAGGMLETEKSSKEKLGGQLVLSLLYCAQKSDRGLVIMESMVPILNELIGAAVKLDGLETHYMRDGEWNMSADGDLGESLTYLAQNAAYFAWCDFDRAVTLAAQFERIEIRMMAQVKLAQAILAGPPKRFQLAHGLVY